ncbi:uncharacterized protein LOC142330214 isoform X4 [Lycorma delicatula]|uniref:uncharacterized protein LOC142330214 isoform X4 n=1 Tax=Lycorma delicatula TaxID=130591 RepID=UPI003F50DAB7
MMYMKVKDVYNSMKFSLLVYNQLICFHCSVMLYCMFQSENLWNAIASSPWQNKPSWFKHSIRMLLIGTQKPLKMEPAGLYVLDLNFFLKVLQVSYSYCNLMLQFNSKKEKIM